MLVGRLDKRVVLQAPRETGGSPTGEPDLVWDDVAEVWASIDNLRGVELEAARQVESRATVKIVVRYWPGLSAKHRCLWHGPDGDEQFEILDVDDRRRRHREMTLTCVRVEGRAGL